jgi:hypothetical protein
MKRAEMRREVRDLERKARYVAAVSEGKASGPLMAEVAKRGIIGACHRCGKLTDMPIRLPMCYRCYRIFLPWQFLALLLGVTLPPEEQESLTGDIPQDKVYSNQRGEVNG